MMAEDERAPDEKVTRLRDPSWEQLVLIQHRDRCTNCGGTERLRVRMVVPEEAGGKKEIVSDPQLQRKVASNGTVLCRVCEMAQEVAARHESKEENRPVNFWVSRTLFDKVKSYNGFTSTSSLVRYLIEKYVRDEARFDDLEMYQDRGNDVKINVWVGLEDYERFKNLVSHRGLTVTDALKALITMYGSDVEFLLPKRS